MIVYAISMSFYLIGYLIFASCATFGIQYWVTGYFLWDKAKDVLFLTSIYHAPKNSTSLMPMILFAGARFVWEIISAITEWNINNTKAVGFLFMASALTIGIILWQELMKWQRLNSHG